MRGRPACQKAFIAGGKPTRVLGRVVQTCAALCGRCGPVCLTGSLRGRRAQHGNDSDYASDSDDEFMDLNQFEALAAAMKDMSLSQYEALAMEK